jgi:uroporphyrinogen-III synthase
VALYLQKFINYRKRKVFYGTDGTNKSMFEAINKHKENERFVYTCSENQQDGEIVNWLKTNNCDYVTAFMYRTVSANVKELLTKTNFDIMCFFTPSGVKSLFENMPKFKQNGTKLGTFGTNTCKAVEEAGLEIAIRAPQPQTPSMIAALDRYLAEVTKK